MSGEFFKRSLLHCKLKKSECRTVTYNMNMLFSSFTQSSHPFRFLLDGRISLTRIFCFDLDPKIEMFRLQRGKSNWITLMRINKRNREYFGIQKWDLLNQSKLNDVCYLSIFDVHFSMLSNYQAILVRSPEFNINDSDRWLTVRLHRFFRRCSLIERLEIDRISDFRSDDVRSAFHGAIVQTLFICAYTPVRDLIIL